MSEKMEQWIIILVCCIWILTADALDGTHAIGNMTVVGPIKVGENITLTFHPTNYSKPHSILLQYREGSGWINVSFERLYEDDIKRVLDFVIPNTKEALNGKDIYIVYNGIWGPYVRIKMSFATKPVLGPLKNVDGCVNCIFAKKGTLPAVQCMSKGDIRLIELHSNKKTTCTITIDNSGSGIHTGVSNNDHCKVSDTDHLSQLTCVVHTENESLRSEPRTLYVAVPPGKPQIETPDPFHSKAHIICRSKGGRPPPQLVMMFDGSALPSEKLPLNENDHAIRLSRVERHWHGKSLTCGYRNEFYNDSTTKTLDIKYKPMISFNVVKAQSHDAAAEQIVTCNAESIPLSDVTISYVDDTGKNVTHNCPSSPDCQITVAIPDTKVTCTAVYQTSLFDEVKYLELSAESGTTNNVLLYILVSLVLCLVVALVIALVVLRKRRRARDKTSSIEKSTSPRPKAEAESTDTANPAQVVDLRTSSQERKDGANQHQTSGEACGHIEECTYSEVVKPKKPKQSATNSPCAVTADIQAPTEKTTYGGHHDADTTYAAVNKPKVSTCPDQLIYADLDKDALNATAQRITATATVTSGDAVEYVGIDFNKKVADQEYRDEERVDGENIYHNQ